MRYVPKAYTPVHAVRLDEDMLLEKGTWVVLDPLNGLVNMSHDMFVKIYDPAAVDQALEGREDFARFRRGGRRKAIPVDEAGQPINQDDAPRFRERGRERQSVRRGTGHTLRKLPTMSDLQAQAERVLRAAFFFLRDTGAETFQAKDLKPYVDARDQGSLSARISGLRDRGLVNAAEGYGVGRHGYVWRLTEKGRERAALSNVQPKLALVEDNDQSNAA